MKGDSRFHRAGSRICRLGSKSQGPALQTRERALRSWEPDSQRKEHERRSLFRRDASIVVRSESRKNLSVWIWALGLCPSICAALLLLALFPLDWNPEAIELRFVSIVGLASALLSLLLTVWRLTDEHLKGARLLQLGLLFVVNGALAYLFVFALLNLPNLNQM
jgi:hypothetical protein